MYPFVDIRQGNLCSLAYKTHLFLFLYNFFYILLLRIVIFPSDNFRFTLFSFLITIFLCIVIAFPYLSACPFFFSLLSLEIYPWISRVSLPFANHLLVLHQQCFNVFCMRVFLSSIFFFNIVDLVVGGAFNSLLCLRKLLNNLRLYLSLNSSSWFL